MYLRINQATGQAILHFCCVSNYVASSYVAFSQNVRNPLRHRYKPDNFPLYNSRLCHAISPQSINYKHAARIPFRIIDYVLGTAYVYVSCYSRVSGQNVTFTHVLVWECVFDNPHMNVRLNYYCQQMCIQFANIGHV